ncbi:hypothetical protein RUM44_004897 [Polyplax serrata]|uniref:Uncharacterized protein n=1 Tax=Polyplax serrata TaxID=468196 RepID=A0ABR1B436_POLSC
MPLERRKKRGRRNRDVEAGREKDRMREIRGKVSGRALENVYFLLPANPGFCTGEKGERSEAGKFNGLRRREMRRERERERKTHTHIERESFESSQTHLGVR